MLRSMGLFSEPITDHIVAFGGGINKWRQRHQRGRPRPTAARYHPVAAGRAGEVVDVDVDVQLVTGIKKTEIWRGTVS